MRLPRASLLWYSCATSEPIAPQFVARPIRMRSGVHAGAIHDPKGAPPMTTATRAGSFQYPTAATSIAPDRSGHDGRRRRGAAGAQRRLGQCHARRAQQAHGAAHARLLRHRRSLGRGEHGGQGTCAGFITGGRGMERGCLHHSSPHAPVSRRARRYRTQWRAAHSPAR